MEFSLYSISIDLTSSGLNHADEVLLNLFEYIQVTRNSSVVIQNTYTHNCQTKQLINSSSTADKLRILNELKQLADIDFQFQVNEECGERERENETLNARFYTIGFCGSVGLCYGDWNQASPLQ